MTKDEFVRGMLSRQQPIFGEESSGKLQESVVAIAGVGGVGALTVELLARAGIGRFRLLDFDIYEISNLNRQVFATTETLGKPKVEVAAERITLINPFATVEQVFHEKAGMENLEKMFDGANVAVIATDSPSSHILAKQVGRKVKLRLIYAYTSCLSCGVYVNAYDLSPGWIQRSIIKRVRRILPGNVHLYEMSEEEALSLDGGNTSSGEFTPTVSFATNAAACLAAALVIKYLTGSDKRTHSFSIAFSKITLKKSNNPLIRIYRGAFRK